MPGPPGATAPRDRVKGAVHQVPPFGIQELAGGEPSLLPLDCLQQPLQPIRRRLNVVVHDRQPLGPRRADAAVHGRTESRVASHLDHAGSRGRRDLRRAVRGSVVGHHDLLDRMCLPGKAPEQPLEKVPPVPIRDDHGHAGHDTSGLTVHCYRDTERRRVKFNLTTCSAAE